MMKIPFGSTQLVADVTPEGSRPSVLFLHGAGKSNRMTLRPLCEALVKDGIASADFDFLGQGDTGGDLTMSSLKERTEQALAVINALDLQKPLTILGSSMSGYTAIKLSEILPVDRLVLFRPGIYRRDVYDVPFSKFTEAIREPESWRKSDAFEILGRFTGEVLIIRAELDAVVPAEIISELYQSATHAKSREVVTVPNMPHSLSYLFDYPEAFDFVYQTVKKFLL